MAYIPAALTLVSQTQAAAGDYSFRIFHLRGTDAVTAVRVDGYITDALEKGLQAGDLVYYLDTDASPLAMHQFTVAAINANGSADLSDGLAITATNTD